MSCGIIGTGRGSFCLLRVPVSQNDCFIEVKLPVFRVHWVSVIALSHPHVNNQFRTSLQDTKILTMFLLSVIEKFIDQLETKLANIDPSLVRQHVQPLKNNYFKPWSNSSNLDKQVLNAQVRVTNFLVQHNIALLTADHLTLLFKEAFPDSKIAKKYALCWTKTTAIINKSHHYKQIPSL